MHAPNTDADERPIWYLSFCDCAKPKGHQWLGGCYVRGNSAEEAGAEAVERGCAPDFSPTIEVLFVQSGEVPVRTEMLNRLLVTAEDVCRAIYNAPDEYSRVSLREDGGIQIEPEPIPEE